MFSTFLSLRYDSAFSRPLATPAVASRALLVAAAPSSYALSFILSTAAPVPDQPVLLASPYSLNRRSTSLWGPLIARISVFLLYHADQFVLLPSDSFEIVIGEFSPPRSQRALHFLPLASKYVVVHWLCSVLFGLIE
jgi:hypothetical protein